MIKKIIVVLLALVVLALLWTAFQALRADPQEATRNFFETDFVSAISQQVTSGLTFNNETSAPEVGLEELGEISPASGLVTITKDEGSVDGIDPTLEYIEIRAQNDNAQPINISDWSLQSLVSDVWYGIPQGVEYYVAGEVNDLADIYLHPGERAIIATKPSPVGVSFRVNRCSGYLGATQEFEPRLSTQCISPRAVVPPTVENIKTYGDTCVELAENFPTCTYLTPAETDMYAQLSSACIERLQPRLTHNFCVGVHQDDADFFAPREWRIFLESAVPLWKEQYEVIRLLDERNRTVDVFSY